MFNIPPYMSHHIYHTRGIILASSPSGESNRYYKIFTEELGLVSAVAQSVREGKSKLRYVLQDYSFVTVDLVRGREVWRIVSAGGVKSHERIKNEKKYLTLLAGFCSLLERLLHGEGRDQELFDEVLRVIDFLENNTIEDRLVLAFETLSIFRVLGHLGYLDTNEYEVYFDSKPYSIGVLEEFEKIRPGVLHKIKEALSASHL